MDIVSARNLRIGDIVKHKHLNSEWRVIEVRNIKKNKGKFRHKLQMLNSVRTYTFTEKGLELWYLSTPVNRNSVNTEKK